VRFSLRHLKLLHIPNIWLNYRSQKHFYGHYESCTTYIGPTHHDLPSVTCDREAGLPLAFIIHWAPPSSITAFPKRCRIAVRHEGYISARNSVFVGKSEILSGKAENVDVFCRDTIFSVGKARRPVKAAPYLPFCLASRKLHGPAVYMEESAIVAYQSRHSREFGR